MIKKVSKRFASEEELAGKVVQYLLSYGWEVYQEVEVNPCGRADIVAVQNDRVWVIEAKQSLGLSVIGQAHNWLDWSHWVSVATPAYATGIVFSILTHFGIGALSVHLDVSESVAPRLNRKANAKHILRSLCEEHKTWAKAGNSANSYYSPFKRTCAEILREVRQEPGIILKELVLKIKHHYSTPSSASSCIRQWAAQGCIPGVQIVKEKSRLRLYPSDSATCAGR